MIDSRIDPDPEPTHFKCPGCDEWTHYDDAAGWLMGPVCCDCGKKLKKRNAEGEL